MQARSSAGKTSGSRGVLGAGFEPAWSSRTTRLSSVRVYQFRHPSKSGAVGEIRTPMVLADRCVLSAVCLPKVSPRPRGPGWSRTSSVPLGTVALEATAFAVRLQALATSPRLARGPLRVGAGVCCLHHLAGILMRDRVLPRRPGVMNPCRSRELPPGQDFRTNGSADIGPARATRVASGPDGEQRGSPCKFAGRGRSREMRDHSDDWQSFVRLTCWARSSLAGTDTAGG